MRIIGIIPARYASTRFPGKPLIDLGGKSMIQRVYEQASKCKALNEVWVATDDQHIFDAVFDFGGRVVMTNADHRNGTERCFEASQRIPKKADYIINIQGDEPFIDPKQIDALAGLLDGKTELGTLIKAIEDPTLLDNPNIMKVVFNKAMEALYFSRNCIPYIRGSQKEEWIKEHQFYKHIGIYAYRQDILERIVSLAESTLEKAESLEQLRWLEHGFTIKLAKTDIETFGIDVPEDLEKAQQYLKNNPT